MKNFVKMMMVLAALLVLGGGQVWAYSYTIIDDYVGSYVNPSADYTSSDGDVIGGANKYGISKMDVTFTGGFMNVKVYTPFHEGIDTFGTRYGDLFISTNGWNPYVSEGSTKSNGYVLDNASNGEVWEFVFDTSEGKLYGGFTSNSFILAEDAPPASNPTGSYIVRNGQEVLRSAVADESKGYYPGVFIPDNSSFTPNNQGGTYLEYNILVASLGSITGEIGLKWGMTCANDTIEGSVPAPVPEPGTLLLLGSGLAGLALYRRRTSK